MSDRSGLLLGLPFLVMTVAACVPVLGDPMPRPVGLGLADDGRVKVVVALCPGERIASVTVSDWMTSTPVWRVSRPSGPGDRITVGDSRGFATVDIPMTTPLPEIFNVSVGLTDGLGFGSASTVEEIGRAGARMGVFMDADGNTVTEDEFRERVAGEYC
ncbi:hypothetical protein GT755_21135 [Herbidospora sp. NEAU-GS84]|uniref:Uncharacterized protein n=1 Tax=Herbidospora solisilvae TaxID=2696284 RepID=A0A7C9J454_9ACTN|nr:hypothetical protein [Herbidospora solisilvae]NAS24186.1 hypothetical protein [Herbidospora solisilvae]